MVDVLTFVGGARGRGVTERQLAKWMGLRDGEFVYTVLRNDGGRSSDAPVISPPVRIPKTAPAHIVATRASPWGSARATTPAIAVGAKCQPTATQVLLDKPIRARVTVADILTAVAREWDVTRDDILSQSRSRPHSQPRMACYLLIRRHTCLSLPAIAKALYRLDHTSCSSGLKRAVQLMETDPDWRARFERAEASLKPKGDGDG